MVGVNLYHACLCVTLRETDVCILSTCYLPRGGFLANSMTKRTVPVQRWTNSHRMRAEGQLGPFLIRKWDFIPSPPADR